MTSELEYSFFNVDFDLRIGAKLMNRAVRVKQAVKDKISRVFASISKVSKSSTSVQSESNNDEVKLSDGTGLEFLIDLSDENVSRLSSKLDLLESQRKVQVANNRAVLFTTNLEDKIERVTSKWYPSNNKPEVENTTLEVASSEPSDEIIPATWASGTELTEEPKQETPSFDFLTPAVESSAEVEPVVSAIEPAVTIPEIEPEKPVENVELPAIEPVIPTYDSSSFEVQPDVPRIEPVITMVPEVDKDINLVKVETEPEFVSEPSELSKTEESVETTKPSMSTEDKITELLNRKRYSFGNEEQSETPKEESTITQSVIMARLQRVSNTMRDKDAQIRTLNGRIDSLTEDNKAYREKLEHSDSIVRELSTKNSELTSQNERLVSENSTIESKYKEKIDSLNAQIDEISITRREEFEASKRELSSLRASHLNEMEELKRAHAEEIKRLEEAQERKIQAILKSIAETIGETIQDDKVL